MMTLTPNDEAERYQSQAERLVISTRAERIGTLDTVLTRIMPTSVAAVEARNKKIIGGATMNGNQIFNPRVANTAPQRVTTMPNQADYNRVVQTQESAPAYTGTVKDEFRAVNEPLAKLKDVNPDDTQKIDADNARLKVDEALRDIPETTLELPQ